VFLAGLGHGSDVLMCRLIGKIGWDWFWNIGGGGLL
jgi:hypothetical protein